MVQDTGELEQLDPTDTFSIDAACTVNEAGADVDFRLEGDSLTHMIFCDASAATENIALVATGAPNWQSMDRGLFIGNASTVPTGNPSSGSYLYSDTTGLLTTRNSAGLVTPIVKPPQVDVFVESGSYTVPTGAVTIEFHCVGGGGGGGAGRKGAAGSNRYGGGGGGGGEYRAASVAASSISGTVTVTVGAAGAGGAFAGTDTTNGGNGSAGSDSKAVDAGATTHCLGKGGSAGSGGTTTTGTGGAGGTGGTGSLANTNGGAGGNGGGAAAGGTGGAVTNQKAGAGGGGGWGIDNTNNIQLGGFGGASAGIGGPWGNAVVIDGFSGGSATAFANGTGIAALGGGGGGGGSSNTVSQIVSGIFIGNGGQGGKFGAGGGGGAGATNATTSFMNGAAGGTGVVIIIARFA